MVSNSCVAGRPIKSALVRCQYRIGLCPKMKYPPFYGGIFIPFIRSALSEKPFDLAGEPGSVVRGELRLDSGNDPVDDV